MLIWKFAKRITPPAIKRVPKANLLYSMIAKWCGPVAHLAGCSQISSAAAGWS